ncbi:MAG: TolC family protein, partial [Treponema sp.]|nr:TolC family protein [Treponema sp.]
VTITLDDAVNRALDANLNLKKILIDVSSTDYQARRLWAEIFPSISASASAGYSNNLFSGNGFEISDKGSYYSASVGLSLGLNAGTVYAVRNIRLAYQNRLLTYEDACNQLEIQVARNFYSLIADRENLDVLNDTFNLASRQFDMNQMGFKNGLISELVVTQSRLALEDARYNLSVARSGYTIALGEFLALLGLDQNTEAVLSGEISIAPFESDAEALIRQYLPGRPDIVSLRREIERLENAEKQTSLANRSPYLDLSLNWRTPNFNPYTDSLSGTALIRIPIDPWISGTKGEQQIRNAKLNIDKARLDLQIAENAASTQIRSLAANVRNSRDSLEIARLSLDAAQRSYELTEQGYKNGRIEYLKLEEARNNLTTVRQRLLRSELACQTALLDLSAALNIKWKELINVR